MADDGKTQLLTCRALAMVHSRQRDECLCESDETDAQCSVHEHFANFVAHTKFFRAEPHALPHQERVIVDAFFALDIEPVFQLTEDKV